MLGNILSLDIKALDEPADWLQINNVETLVTLNDLSPVPLSLNLSMLLYLLARNNKIMGTINVHNKILEKQAISFSRFQNSAPALTLDLLRNVHGPRKLFKRFTQFPGKHLPVQTTQ